MKKVFRKAACVFLSALMLAALFVPLAGASSANVPVVFVGGRGTTLKDKDENTIYPMTFDKKQYILDASKEVLPLLGKAVLTDDYDEYCDALYEKAAAVYDDVRLNKDGEVDNGSHSPFAWSKQSLSWKVRADSDPYQLYDYAYYYDWRLDMWEIADGLNAFINDVLEVTNSSKVRLVGRCMGGNIVTAYLTKYGCEKIEKCLFYETTANGTAECGAPFSGQLSVKGDALARYASDLLGDDSVNDLIRSSLNLYNSATGMALPVGAVTALYNKIAANIVPRLVMSTYGSFPSYWEMVDPAHFEAAKKNAFGGKEEEYARFIEKIDFYHENVLLKIPETLKKCESEGMEIYVVAKYGRQLVPICDEAKLLGDDTVELVSSSFGATCCEVGKTLSDKYLKNQIEAGKGCYISPDRQVDASTCLYPDRTWFIKNCGHMDFDKFIDDMMLNILRFEGGADVDTFERYPQFMVRLEAEDIVPMTEENSGAGSSWNPPVKRSLFDFIFSIIRFFAELIKNNFQPVV